MPEEAKDRALHLAGQSFSPNGLHTGITPMLSRFLHKAGFQHIDKMAHVVDFSAGTDANKGFYEDLRIGFKLVQPFQPVEKQPDALQICSR